MPRPGFGKGIVELAEQHNAAAVNALNKAAALDPKNVDILYQRGRAALEPSRQNYEQMFQQAPDSWHVHLVLAEAAVEGGKDAEAVSEYRLAIASAPPQGCL